MFALIVFVVAGARAALVVLARTLAGRALAGRALSARTRVAHVLLLVLLAPVLTGARAVVARAHSPLPRQFLLVRAVCSSSISPDSVHGRVLV